MSMSKKDYVLIADVLRTSHRACLRARESSIEKEDKDMVKLAAMMGAMQSHIVRAFVEKLKENNPRFDVDRFVDHIEEGTVIVEE